MNGFAQMPGWSSACLAARVGGIVLGTFLAGSVRVDAAAIHSNHEKALVNPADYRTWSEYITGGPNVWSHVAHPALNQEIEAAMWKNIRSDPPPDTSALVNYFLYKQSLDPARFDHYHPRLARALAKIEAQLVNPTTSPTTSTQPQTITPPSSSSVPEPSTVFLTLGMASYAIWWRRRARREKLAIS
jgi:hypothetical protein